MRRNFLLIALLLTIVHADKDRRNPEPRPIAKSSRIDLKGLTRMQIREHRSAIQLAVLTSLAKESIRTFMKRSGGIAWRRTR